MTSQTTALSSHIAWQQRVNQERNIAYSSMQSGPNQPIGLWSKYPDLVNYLNTPQMEMGWIPNQRKFGQTQFYSLRDDEGSNFAYAAKSSLINKQERINSKLSQRSKTSSKVGGPTNRVQRFNETSAQQDGDTKSKLSKYSLNKFGETASQNRAASSRGSQRLSFAKSKPASQTKNSDIQSWMSQKSKQSVLSATLAAPKDEKAEKEAAEEGNLDEVEVKQPEDAPGEEGEKAEEEGEAQAEGAEEPLESASQVQVAPSQISNLSQKTYISELQKQLNDERVARQKLESELQDLKQITSQVSTQIASVKKAKEEHTDSKK